MSASQMQSLDVKSTGNPTVAQVLLEYLKLEKVTHIFGIPGGGIANLINELKNQRADFEYVVCRHESGAAYMADGYFRASGNLGVVLVTTGPGATNALTGAMNAQNGCTALLVLTGEVNEQYLGMGYLQEGSDSGLDINAIFAAATRYSAIVVDQSDFTTLLRQALRDALSRPRRVSHLSVPNNVAAEMVATPRVPKSPDAYRALPSGVSASQVSAALDLLAGCRRPLILVGNGCREALRRDEVLKSFHQFVTQWQIPVITTADAKGLFPESDPLSLRVYGCAGCMWPYFWMKPEDTTAPYDGLVVIGSSLGELSTNSWNPMMVPMGPFIQVDLDQAMIARSFDVTLGIVAEAGSFIEELVSQASQRDPDPIGVDERRNLVTTLKQAHSPFISPESYEANRDPIHPAALMRVLQESLPEDAMIFVDAGNCVGWGLHYLEVDPPQQIHSSLAMGPMGFGVAAVVGAKVARPDLACVALVGDGAFMMHGTEVSTAKRIGAGAIWVVLYDDYLNMVSQGMSHFFPDKDHPQVWDSLYELGGPDLVQVSRGLGAEAYSVSSAEEMRTAMVSALSGASVGTPQVIVVKIDRSDIPPYYNPLYSGH
jgi:acetolactate synthase I/II/III large subunit